MVKMYSLLTARPRYLQGTFTPAPYRGLVTKLVVLSALLVLAVPASAARLPILASQDLWPVFSGDGRHVAFTRVDGQGRIFALEVADLSRRPPRAVGLAASQLSPTWSSDGRLAYASGGTVYG
jgi:hypothetical protein